MHDIDHTMNGNGSAARHAVEETELDQLEAEFYGFNDEVFDEAQELELAAELLSVSDDAELEQFLGGLIKKAGQAVGKFVKSPVGKQIGGFVKGAVKKALPAIGGIAGGYFAGPAGAAIGSKVASMGGQMLGLELEGLSPEDQEFEVSRRLVRFAGEAVKQATQQLDGDPRAVAKAAVLAAARKHAPGLTRPQRRESEVAAVAPQAQSSGRWTRQGHKIVLHGV